MLIKESIKDAYEEKLNEHENEFVVSYTIKPVDTYGLKLEVWVVKSTRIPSTLISKNEDNEKYCSIYSELVEGLSDREIEQRIEHFEKMIIANAKNFLKKKELSRVYKYRIC